MVYPRPGRGLPEAREGSTRGQGVVYPRPGRGLPEAREGYIFKRPPLKAVNPEWAPVQHLPPAILCHDHHLMTFAGGVYL